jgi:predicted TIM-barrel fold metal-dependent hydrolase
MDPVLAEINGRRLPVYVHPYACDCDQDVLPGVPLSMIEFPHSTTRAIVSMLNAGTFTRFPDIPWIFSHAGGTVPFLVNRISAVGAALGTPNWTSTLQRLYYDTAGSANRAALGPLLQLVTAKQVLLGTDFPFSGGAGQTVANLAQLGFSDVDLGDIQSGNARRLFPRRSA